MPVSMFLAAITAGFVLLPPAMKGFCYHLCAIFILLLSVCPGRAFCQSGFTRVEGLPTNEVFDLLVDRKGYVWVAHDMGISRFDGVSFTHFSHPERSSLSITDIVEDPQGRIWFHNFTGQVFYVENERVHLLSAYQNESEEFFPRMVLLGDEVVVTSNKGLFVCNTRTLQSRYERLPGNPGTRSLAVVGGEVLANNYNLFYRYSPQGGFRKTPLLNTRLPLYNRNMVLQTQGMGDTALVVSNPSGMVYHLRLEPAGLRLTGDWQIPGYLNAVQLLERSVWIHAKDQSRVMKGKLFLPGPAGYNISDMAHDRQGNLWISSLTHGLLVQANQGHILTYQPPYLQPGELVSAMSATNDTLLVGSKKGRLYLLKANTLAWQYQLPEDIGDINLIAHPVPDRFVISTSVGTYLFFPQKKVIQKFFAFISKDIAVHHNRLLVSSAVGLFAYPLKAPADNLLISSVVNQNKWNDWWQQYHLNPGQDTSHTYYWYKPRSRSLALTGSKDLYVSFMNGVYHFRDADVVPVMAGGKKVYANSMVAVGGKLYIGSLNQGLIIKDGTRTKIIGAEQGLFSSSIVRLKVTGPYLWLLQDRGIQLLNLHTEQIVSDIELPQEAGSNILDIHLAGDTALMATNRGMVKVVMKPSENYKMLHSELKLVVANNADTLSLKAATLQHNQNDINFHLSVPWFDAAKGLYFKYRLLGSANPQWYNTLPGEKIIRFASIMPGSYHLEAYAVVSGFQEPIPVRYHFTIARPWWRTWTFNLLLLAVLALLFYLLYRLRLRRMEHLAQVRQAISSDLHDEIGSTISSINIYSELAKSEPNNEAYLQLIQENTREVIGKLDDLVWSINPRNDSISQLVARMRSVAEPVLIGAGIQPQFLVSEGIAELELPLEIKRNFYLVFKELINNVVKHSKASTCHIQLFLQPGSLDLTIADNGIGFSEATLQQGRSGMYNMQERALQVKARFSISSKPGSGTRATLQLPVKY